MKYITLIISIAGFLLSSAQWIYTLYSKRANYKISIEKFEWYEHSKYNRCILSLSIQNLSGTPLIITRMSINDIQCYLSHQFVGERYFPHFPETDIPYTERVLSVDFPINIVANSGMMCKVIFDFSDKTFSLEKIIELNVQTTNKSKSHTLYCPDKSYNLKL